MITLAFAALGGFGIFRALCVTAPVWDEDPQEVADDVVAVAERA